MQGIGVGVMTDQISIEDAAVLLSRQKDGLGDLVKIKRLIDGEGDVEIIERLVVIRAIRELATEAQPSVSLKTAFKRKSGVTIIDHSKKDTNGS